MARIEGRRISELDRTRLPEEADEFLVSRNYNPETINEFSKKISYRSIVDDIAEDITANVRLSSMGLQETNQYARKNHGHDYSNVHAYARPRNMLSALSQIGKTELAMEITTWNDGEEKTVSVYYPVQSFRHDYAIGEVKFLAVGKLSAIDIDSDDFDGWVYPDGSEYSKDRFPEAWKAFSTDPNSDRFRVPVLSGFFKPNPFAYSGVSYETVPGNDTGMLEHSHSVEVDAQTMKSVKVEVAVQIPTNEDCNETQTTAKSIHRRGQQWNKHTFIQEGEYSIVDPKISLSVTGGQFQSASDDSETYPSHNFIPAMVFIGGMRE